MIYEILNQDKPFLNPIHHDYGKNMAIVGEKTKKAFRMVG